LSGAGLEDFIPGYGPGKFVFESGHCLLFLMDYTCDKTLCTAIGKFTDIITGNQYILEAINL
jgi:hypothetical protein